MIFLIPVPLVVDRIEAITGKRPTFYQLDVADKDALRAVFAKEKIEAAIHFAAFKAVGESVQKPGMYYENNIMSILSLVEVMAEFDVKKIVFSSSATVYGSLNPSPYKEDMPVGIPTSPYGQTRSCVSRFYEISLFRTQAGLSPSCGTLTPLVRMSLV